MLLAACQLGLPQRLGGGGTKATEALITPEITVSTLPELGSKAENGAETVVQGGADPEEPVAEASVEPTEEATPPPVVKSAAQTACEKGGGHFIHLDTSNVMTCQNPTRDGGKQCRRATDCEGACLARSNTCAPAKPLFGCNDVLEADGRRLTLCIE